MNNKYLLQLSQIAPYFVLALLISTFSTFNFFEAVAIILGFKWAFQVTDTITKRLSFKLAGKQKLIDYVLETLHKNQFPPRDNFNESFDDYISEILLNSEKYSKEVVNHCRELELELNKVYVSDYGLYLKMYKAMDEALDLYSPKYKAQGIFPPKPGKFDVGELKGDLPLKVDLLDTKNKIFKKILDEKISAHLVNLYLATRYYPSWCKRDDFDSWNFGVDDVRASKGKILGENSDFVTFKFKGFTMKIGGKLLYGIDTKSKIYEDVQAIKLEFDGKAIMELIFKKKLDDYIVSDFKAIDVVEYHENRKCLELLKVANELIEKFNNDRKKAIISGSNRG